MGRPRVDFGEVWEPPGRVCAVLGALLAASGSLLGVSWSLLDVFWVLLGRFWLPLGQLWVGLGAPRLDFQGFRMPPSHVLGSSGSSFVFGFWMQCVYYRMNLSIAFTYAFRSSLQRGGTCAAHPPPPERRAERAGSLKSSGLAKILAPTFRV